MSWVWTFFLKTNNVVQKLTLFNALISVLLATKTGNNHLAGVIPSELKHLQKNLLFLNIGMRLWLAFPFRCFDTRAFLTINRFFLNQTGHNELEGSIVPEVGDLWKLCYLDLGETNKTQSLTRLWKHHFRCISANSFLCNIDVMNAYWVKVIIIWTVKYQLTWMS